MEFLERRVPCFFWSGLVLRLSLFELEETFEVLCILKFIISSNQKPSEDQERPEVGDSEEEPNVGEESGGREISEGQEHRVVGALKGVETGTHEGHEVSQVGAAAGDRRIGEVRDRAALLTERARSLIKEETLELLIGNHSVLGGGRGRGEDCFSESLDRGSGSQKRDLEENGRR